MIAFWNRAQLTTVFSMEKLTALRNALAEEGIESTVKMPGAAADGVNRAGLGSLEPRNPLRREYLVYGKKTDLPRALGVLRSGKTDEIGENRYEKDRRTGTG